MKFPPSLGHLVVIHHGVQERMAECAQDMFGRITTMKSAVFVPVATPGYFLDGWVPPLSLPVWAGEGTH